MDSHYCPMCGEHHGGVAVGTFQGGFQEVAVADSSIPSDEVAVTAIETVGEVAEAAIEALVETHTQEEETERLEAVADVVEAAIEEEPEVVAPEPEPEPIEPEVMEEEDEDAEEPEELEGEPTPVTVPPQLSEAPKEPSSSSRTTSKFRSHRRH